MRISLLLAISVIVGCQSSKLVAVKNCKLSIRMVRADGSVRVSVEERSAASRDHCKALAKESENSSDREIASIKTSFSWKE
jgi:ribosome recycling factor